MNIQDQVYGIVEIREPILLGLINSPTLQRLKDIDQAGYSEPYFPGKYSRFEHSVGVCLLLRKYKASLEEQIAGLIHDVSHSAFSHCIDYVLASDSAEKNAHQDNIFDAYVRKSEIPALLEAYSFDINYILDDTHFPLKEKELPDLCADRIDYSLRTACAFGEIEDANYFLNALETRNGTWIFKNFETAKAYAELFLKLNTNYWSGIATALMFQTVGEYLQYALSKGYISEVDLYTTDASVLSKIARHHADDEQLSLLFDRMNNKVPHKNNPHDFERDILCKSRVVDPLCRHNGEIKRVSHVDPNWGEILKEESKPKHHFLKFEH
ncbi:HD domain-containing protein [Candidatus Kaiserbacteria bacterium]|nr:HD domain-containing protein [Candidatus Kaiserbacteria bacterium]